MKKFFLLLILSTTLVFAGCGADNLSIVKQNIVEHRDAYYIHQTDEHIITYVAGMREEPYYADGVVGEMVEFGILTFTPAKTLNYESLNYFVVIDNIEYEGLLEKSDFQKGFVVDLEKCVDNNSTISVRVFEDDVEVQGTLKCASKDFAITQDTALQTAYSTLSTQIKSHINKSKFGGEVYIKIWKDFSSEADYFWYIGIVCESETLGVLISTQTGEVLSVKK